MPSLYAAAGTLPSGYVDRLAARRPRSLASWPSWHRASGSPVSGATWAIGALTQRRHGIGGMAGQGNRIVCSANTGCIRDFEHNGHGCDFRSAVPGASIASISIWDPQVPSCRFLSAAVRAFPQPLPNRPYVTLPSTKLSSLAAVPSVAVLLSNQPLQLEHIVRSFAVSPNINSRVEPLPEPERIFSSPYRNRR
ncbi:hypothetical protein SNOG_05202 [Parastagonospora nodorum SN15]|uniref:Uncharacterized protein n=1 Tax=Phaeosphaeria nodorum (strain SN15 / ATCC MYA-4574 / FGSC 10173) TaxID=321614 RepID=Q0USR2_PHANO|nr:hypothetical protein SNOG_05202 [Parastagonospora nodorum SN15]EAT87593.1 hypothetical protein SNOG_05202 [Parastagonospora nodorum SN15]